MKKGFRTLRGKLSIIALSYSFGTSVFLTIASFLFMRSYITENLINSSTSTLKLIAETIEQDIKSIRQFEHWCSVSGEFSDIGKTHRRSKNPAGSAIHQAHHHFKSGVQQFYPAHFGFKLTGNPI